MSPDVLNQSGILELLGLMIITAGDVNTCKTSSGSSLLDYILCDPDLAPLIGDLSLEVGPWSPHSSVRFSINRRCEHIKTLQLRRPKPLPESIDDKRVPTQWHLDQRQWDQLLEHSAKEAIAAVDDTRSDNEEVWQHAGQLNIGDEARDRSIQYAQWSIA